MAAQTKEKPIQYGTGRRDTTNIPSHTGTLMSKSNHYPVENSIRDYLE
jgi:hypothetical protein